tara:strand:- start:304 stop:459 length:156 start_codon:yes stop_codon:yes gene_type:complete
MKLKAANKKNTRIFRKDSSHPPSEAKFPSRSWKKSMMNPDKKYAAKKMNEK